MQAERRREENKNNRKTKDKSKSSKPETVLVKTNKSCIEYANNEFIYAESSKQSSITDYFSGGKKTNQEHVNTPQKSGRT